MVDGDCIAHLEGAAPSCGVKVHSGRLLRVFATRREEDTAR